MRLGSQFFSLTVLGGALTALLASASSALAFAPPPSGAPGPLIGVGLPVGAVIVGAIVARRFRRNDRND